MLKTLTIKELEVLQHRIAVQNGVENANLGAVLFATLYGVSKEELFHMTEEVFIEKVREAQQREEEY